ncbi:MAG: OmpA family protein [Nonlabens sp.]|uniref:OmpA family protein n=1 Tax=Nonlabens sp. TaxID=1888209 RepID=UPI00321ACC25
MKKYKVTNYRNYVIKYDRYYSDTDRWALMELEFIATGNENYFTIGNTNKNSKTDKRLRTMKNRQNMSYYYIDNVSLIDLNQVIEIEKPKAIIQETQITESNFNLNSIYTLKSIQFDFDKATLIEKTTEELDELATYLHKNPERKIQINGHTDYLGKTAYNQKLSEERAKSVADYLILKGIPKKRIISKGYGESQPIDPNEPEDAQAKNRRVEFILSK